MHADHEPCCFSTAESLDLVLSSESISALSSWLVKAALLGDSCFLCHLSQPLLAFQVLVFFLSCLVIPYVQPSFLYPQVLSFFPLLPSLSRGALPVAAVSLFPEAHALDGAHSPSELWGRVQLAGGALNIQSLFAQLAFSLWSNSSSPFSHSLSTLIFGSSSNLSFYIWWQRSPGNVQFCLWHRLTDGVKKLSCCFIAVKGE